MRLEPEYGRLRIVFVLSGLGAGGAEKIVNLLASRYAALGHDVTVIALAGQPEESYFDYPAKVSFRSRPLTKRAGRAFWRLSEILWLRRQLTEIEPDVVVSFLTKINFMTAIAASGLKVRVIASERNNPGLQMSGSLWRYANMATVRLADCLVMQTEKAAASLGLSEETGSIVIPNPCTVAPHVRECVSGPAEFVAVGRLSPQKGFDRLIEAFCDVAQTVDGATLTIFGEGPERHRLENMVAQAGLGNRISLPGRTSTPGAWMLRGNIFVLSSVYEGFPNALVEALSAGYPVIAFDCPWGPAEILKDPASGVLVPNKDVAALGKAMIRLARFESVRSDYSRAAPSAASRFSMPEILALWDRTILAPLTMAADRCQSDRMALSGKVHRSRTDP